MCLNLLQTYLFPWRPHHSYNTWITWVTLVTKREKQCSVFYFEMYNLAISNSSNSSSSGNIRYL